MKGIGESENFLRKLVLENGGWANLQEMRLQRWLRPETMLNEEIQDLAGPEHDPYIAFESRLVRKEVVLNVFGYSETQLNVMIEDGLFPPAIDIMGFMFWDLVTILTVFDITLFAESFAADDAFAKHLYKPAEAEEEGDDE